MAIDDAGRVEFIIDVGSPNAYLAFHALGPVLDRTGAELKLVPCLLGGIFKATGNQPPLMAFANIPAKLDYVKVEMDRFIGRHGLHAFRFNEHFPVNTLVMMRAALVAERAGRLEEYLRVTLAAMWEENLKMDEPRVFSATLSAHGFDGKALLEATQDPEVKEALVKNTENAVARGVFGIPTFFLAGEMYFGKDSLPDLEEALQRS